MRSRCGPSCTPGARQTDQRSCPPLTRRMQKPDKPTRGPEQQERYTVLLSQQVSTDCPFYFVLLSHVRNRSLCMPPTLRLVTLTSPGRYTTALLAKRQSQ
jgi:hypothetical protein